MLYTFVQVKTSHISLKPHVWCGTRLSEPYISLLLYELRKQIV